jgi:serine phosphatase RsbU (regulator of sigma subunit)
MEDFENHEVQLKEGDRLYMFSDGYTDQFGGNDYRKFMAKAFKELIASTSLVPIGEQGVEIEKTFKAWTNYKDLVHEQIDDVTVVGVQV